MPGTRTRKQHPCKNHSGRKARGRCRRCGRWVCSDCSVVVQGSILCTDTCTPHLQTAGVPLPPQHDAATTPTAPAPLPRRTVSMLVALILIAAGVTGWSLQRTFRLEEENRLLLRSNHQIVDRVNLLSERIRTLENRQTHPADTLAPSVPSGTKPAPQKPSIPASLEPRGRLPLSFDNGTLQQKLVCLTFDGGGAANSAHDILDTLASRSVKSTMFLTGGFIRAFPAIVRRIVAQGHEVGNHTMTHPHLTTWTKNRTHQTREGVDAALLGRELALANERFISVTGQPMVPLWRAPYGERNAELCRWGQQWGYLHVGWRQGKTWLDNLDTNDWIPDSTTPGYRRPDEVYDKILAHARSHPHGLNGGIILMHLGTMRKSRNEQVHLILGRLIDDIAALGYRFTTVSELAAASGVDTGLLPPVKKGAL